MIESILYWLLCFCGVLALFWLAESVVTWYRNEGPFRIAKCNSCRAEETIYSYEANEFRYRKCDICNGDLTISEELDI